MELAALDALLTRLTEAERAVSANLLELEEQPTYKLLGAATLRGVSAHRVGPALTALGELWQQFSLLRDLLLRARDLRGDDKGLPTFRRNELEQLLTGPSITLSVDQVPLSQRDLLGAAQTTNLITPQGLLDAMTRAFDAARDAVFAVEAVWRDTLPRIDQASQRATTMVATVTKLGLAPAEVGPLAGLQARISTLQQAITDDPLGAHAGFDADVAPLLAAAEAAVADLSRQHATLPADFDRAATDTAELADLIAAGHAALAEAQAKIAQPQGLLQPLGTELVEAERDGLRPWLARLSEIRASGDWRVARRGLDQFLRTSAARLDAARRVHDANRAPIARRNELRGLLDAYRVKASAKGQSEDATQAARYRAAREALYTAPCDVDRAAELVAAYGRATTTPSGSGGARQEFEPGPTAGGRG